MKSLALFLSFAIVAIVFVAMLNRNDPPSPDGLTLQGRDGPLVHEVELNDRSRLNPSRSPVAGNNLEIRLVDSLSGAPIMKASARLFVGKSLLHKEGGESHVKSETNDLGVLRFSTEFMDGIDSVSLVVSSSGYADEFLRIDPDPDVGYGMRVDCEMKPFGPSVRSKTLKLFLRVSSEQGMSLEGIDVWGLSAPHELGYSVRPNHAEIVRPVSESEGAHGLGSSVVDVVLEMDVDYESNLEIGYVDLWVGSPGHIEGGGSLVLDESSFMTGEHVGFSLSTSGYVCEGVVMDFDSGQVIRDARVMLFMAGVGQNSRGRFLAETRSDSEGHFRMDSLKTEGLPASLRAEADGFAITHVLLPVQSMEQGANVQVSMKRPARVFGTITDLGEASVANRIVAVVASESGPPPLGILVAKRPFYAMTVTDEAGNYSIDVNFSAEHYSLIVSGDYDSSGAVRRVLARGNQLTVWNSISLVKDFSVLPGREAQIDALVGNGLTLKGVLKDAPLQKGLSLTIVGLLRVNGGVVANASTLEPDGHFSFLNVEPGDYQIGVFVKDRGWVTLADKRVNPDDPGSFWVDGIVYPEW